MSHFVASQRVEGHEQKKRKRRARYQDKHRRYEHKQPNFAEKKNSYLNMAKCHYPMASTLFVAWDRIEVAFRVWESERRHRKRDGPGPTQTLEGVLLGLNHTQPETNKGRPLGHPFPNTSQAEWRESPETAPHQQAKLPPLSCHACVRSRVPKKKRLARLFPFFVSPCSSLGLVPPLT